MKQYFVEFGDNKLNYPQMISQEVDYSVQKCCMQTDIQKLKISFSTYYYACIVLNETNIYFIESLSVKEILKFEIS